MPKSVTSEGRQIRFALAAMLIAGAALRIWQYAANTSMWLDEIVISQSIVALPLSTLLTASLPFRQVAPKGFLLVEKAAVVALGPSDLALRIFPLLCALVALIVFWRIATRVLSGAGPLVAVTMFAFAVPLIHFGALTKQYSGDVLVALALTWLAMWLISGAVSSRRGWYAGVAGAVLVWFSQPSVFMVGGLGAAIVISCVWLQPRTDGRLRAVAPTLVLWGLSTAAMVQAAKVSISPAVGDFLKVSWGEGFPPVTLAGWNQTRWPLDQLEWVFGQGNQGSFGYPFPLLYVGLTAGGYFILWKRNRRFALLLSGPLFFAIVAAILRRYPFSGRLMLFLMPGFFIAIAAFIESMRHQTSSISRYLGAALALLLVAPTIYPVTAMPPPYRVEDMKPVLGYVQANRHDNDAIYVFDGARQAVMFYGPRYGIEHYTLGRNNPLNNRCYLKDLDAFRTQPRVWVIITRGSDRFRARDNILGYLDAIGVRRNSFSVQSRGAVYSPEPAEAFLYDLSDAARLSAADASSFPLVGPDQDSTVRCLRGRNRTLSAADVQEMVNRMAGQ